MMDESICALKRLNIDCSFCLSSDLNDQGQCKWCITSSESFLSEIQYKFSIKDRCIPSRLQCVDPKGETRREITIYDGIDMCELTEMEWGGLSCSARQNMMCGPCLRDTGCAWCPLENIRFERMPQGYEQIYEKVALQARGETPNYFTRFCNYRLMREYLYGTASLRAP